MNPVFIIGCGYVGQRLAQHYLAHNASVSALSHTPKHQASLRSAGLQVFAGDLDQPDTLPVLPLRHALLFYLAPPPSQGQTDPRLQGFLDTLSSDNLPSKCVLISTTSVYGDCQGAWIDETQALNPQVDRARRRVDAEQCLRRWATAHHVEFVILRVPGIYGVGRLPRRRLEQALPMLEAAAAPYSNRIHVDDLVQACVAAGSEAGHSGEIYHVSDGHPSTMTDYFNQVADALQLARPTCVSAEQAQKLLSPEMLSYLSESKRLDVCKMREQLGVVLRYPHLAEGLLQSL